MIFVAPSGAITVLTLSVLVVEAIDRHSDTPHWERKARKYERKADRLMSLCVLLSVLPSFTGATSHNLAVFADRYRDLAEECRRNNDK